MKRRIIKYLSITKKEWNGMVVLVVLMLAILAAPYAYRYLHKDTPINFKDFYALSARLQQAGDTAVVTDDIDSAKKSTNQPMFAFDPNNITEKQWQQLGLSLHQASVIAHYKAKGGKFFSKADMKKIYTLTDEDYKRLAPYISLPDAAPLVKINTKPVMIELNRADSAKLTEISGIGPSYASRIISYRNRLGGFITKKQLLEVYGLSATLYNHIKDKVYVKAPYVKKININTISVNQLRIFPYLKYKQANAIIEYRTQHGPYHSLTDVSSVAILDNQTLTKIAAYINYQ